MKLYRVELSVGFDDRLWYHWGEVECFPGIVADGEPRELTRILIDDREGAVCIVVAENEQQAVQIAVGRGKQ